MGLVVLVAACRGDTERAADRVQKAQEQVQEQREDLARGGPDVTEQESELAAAERAATAARDAYKRAVDGRLAAVDERLAELERSTDPSVAQRAPAVRSARDQLAAMLQQVDSQNEGSWKAFSEDIEAQFDEIERSLGATGAPPAPDPE